MKDGAPDYTATRRSKGYKIFKNYQARLKALVSSKWAIEQKVDF